MFGIGFTGEVLVEVWITLPKTFNVAIVKP
jgi:hypothetical protein